VHGELRFSLSINDGEMAATALVVLEGAPLFGQQTFQFASVHERHIAVVIDDRNKNVVPGFRSPADGSDPMRPAVDFGLRVRRELTMEPRVPRRCSQNHLGHLVVADLLGRDVELDDFISLA
jgi:hypothetical protein